MHAIASKVGMVMNIVSTAGTVSILSEEGMISKLDAAHSVHARVSIVSILHILDGIANGIWWGEISCPVPDRDIRT